METRIYVITVSFNDLDGLKETINSVDSQNHDDIFHIIIDGGTKNFKEILEMQRIRNAIYVTEPDGGIYDAMNKGLSYCQEGIVCWLNSSDVYESENTLSRVNESFLKNDWLWAYGAMKFSRSRETREDINWQYPFNSFLLAFGFRWIPHPSTFYHTRLISQLQKYDEAIEIASDQDFILRASKIALPQYLPFVCVTMKPGGTHTSLSGLDRERIWQKIRKKNGRLLFHSLLADNIFVLISPIFVKLFYLYQATWNRLVIKRDLIDSVRKFKE